MLLSKARISQASRCSSICEEREEACPSVRLSSWTLPPSRRSKSLPELGHSFIHSTINSTCSFCSGWVLLEMHFPSIAPHISVHSQISSLPTLHSPYLPCSPSPLLFLKCSRHNSASGPVHWPFLLPGTFAPRYLLIFLFKVWVCLLLPPAIPGTANPQPLGSLLSPPAWNAVECIQ